MMNGWAMGRSLGAAWLEVQRQGYQVKPTSKQVGVERGRERRREV
jgi:hypothetical protein